MIEITHCSIPRAWYMDHIGKRFKVEREEKHEYVVRTPQGHTNVVRKSDAVFMGK
jgi:hypothetical protein